MNIIDGEARERSPAAERLLDASLAQLFGREVRHSRVHSRPRLLAAALVLLGAGVVAATALWGRGRAADPATLQEPQPAPLPDEVAARGAAELAALPADTQNLVFRLAGPAELPGLQRLPRLRRLQLLDVPVDPRAAPLSSAWDSKEVTADAESLAPLAGLPMLEQLDLPFGLALRPEHLRSLRSLPNLRSIAFSTPDLAGEALAGALLELPALREVRLSLTPVDASFFDALGRRSPRSLALLACPGLGEEAWASIGRLRAVRHLEVTCQNGGSTRSGQLGTLGAPAFAAFAALPELRELLLDESEFDERMFPRLPERLERLDLGDRPMSPLAADSLRRLGNLKDLTFGCGLAAEPAADLIGALRLQRLDYRGRELPVELLRAIAAQPDLRDLRLKVRSPDIDLTPLAAMPSLTMLEVASWLPGRFGGLRQGPDVDQLKALRGCRALRRLVLFNCDLATAELVRVLPGVEIRVVEQL